MHFSHSKHLSLALTDVLPVQKKLCTEWSSDLKIKERG